MIQAFQSSIWTVSLNNLHHFNCTHAVHLTFSIVSHKLIQNSSYIITPYNHANNAYFRLFSSAVLRTSKMSLLRSKTLIVVVMMSWTTLSVAIQFNGNLSFSPFSFVYWDSHAVTAASVVYLHIIVGRGRRSYNSYQSIKLTRYNTVMLFDALMVKFIWDDANHIKWSHEIELSCFYHATPRHSRIPHSAEYKTQRISNAFFVTFVPTNGVHSKRVTSRILGFACYCLHRPPFNPSANTYTDKQHDK